MKLTVNVEASDIRLGDRLAPYHCPVAFALCRATGKVWAVGIGCLLYRGGLIDAPPVVAAFVRAFDLRETVKPFTFTLEVPDSLYEHQAT